MDRKGLRLLLCGALALACCAARRTVGGDDASTEGTESSATDGATSTTEGLTTSSASENEKSCGDDPVEPDGPHKAIEIWPLDGEANGFLCPDEDNSDWYWFEQPEPGWAEPGANFDQQEMEAKIEVYNEEGSELLGQHTWSGGGRGDVVVDIDTVGVFFVEVTLLSPRPADRGFPYTVDISINQG